MKLKSKLILFATLMVAMMLSFSCSDSGSNGTNPPDGPVQVAFSTDIELPKNVSTRVDGNQWEVNDEVGIYMVHHGQTLPGGLVENVANRCYKVESAGADAKNSLKPLTINDAIYFPMDASTVDFIAYYPFKETSELSGYDYPVDLTTQTSTKANDLLYSTGGTGNSNNNSVTLHFEHMLANVTLQLTRGHGITDAQFQAKVIKVNGMPATASFSLGNGTFSNVGSVTPITAQSSKNPTGTLYEIIVLPQTTVGTYTQRAISITLDGKDYLWYIPDGTTFEAGKKYIYKMTLTANGIEMTNFSITPWEPVSDLGDTDDWEHGSEIKFTPDMIERVNIPAGKFWMGAPDGTTQIKIGNNTFKPGNDPNKNADGREVPIHEVQITKPFALGKYTVTCKQYCYFLNSFRNDPKSFVAINGDEAYFLMYLDGARWEGYVTGNYSTVAWCLSYDPKSNVWSPRVDAGIDYSDYPVTAVTYYGAKAFCDWVGGRLPTEAEWEYACRGGRYFDTYTDGSLPYRWDIDGGNLSGAAGYANLTKHAWFRTNNTPAAGDGYATGVKPVGKRDPNGYGLHDMHGNVWEWVNDWYMVPYYSTIAGSLAVDPTGPTDDDMVTEVSWRRVIRGGQTNDTYGNLRSSARAANTESTRSSTYGFRVLFPL